MAVETVESQVGKRDGGNFKGCGNHMHGNIRGILVHPRAAHQTIRTTFLRRLWIFTLQSHQN